MGAIIVEGVLFVALLAAGGALLYWTLLMFTPAGVRIQPPAAHEHPPDTRHVELVLDGQDPGGECLGVV